MVSLKVTLFLVSFNVFIGVIVSKLENSNPYVFDNDDFNPLFNTQEGEFKVLNKFTQRSQLFKEIEDVRMFIFEINPLGFVIPSHWDSDLLFLVGQGRGTITLVFEERIESFNLQKGHLMTIPAGVTFFMINGDDHEKLVLTGFVKTIANTGGHFSSFFGVGGQNPESFYYAFSPDVLESVFNTSSDRLQKVFSQQTKGVIIKASKDQIKALTVKEDTHFPYGNSYCLENYGPCQVFNYPGLSCECGKLFMVIPDDYLGVEKLDMYISFSHTSQGCMSNPFHSSRVTKVIAVINGRGRFEMAAPDNDEGSTEIRYKKMTAELRRGMMFVVPPGHQLILMAAPDEDLENINFEFHAKGNAKYTFGGIHNVLKNLPKEAKDLTFATSAELVDDLLNIQHTDFFVRTPIRPQHQHTADF